MTPEQQAALDATAAERASTLGLPHVVDGPQPYHANALTPAQHVPGNVVTDPDPVPPVDLEDPSEAIPEAPPVDNAHVADGCEQFAEQEQTSGNA